MLVLSLDNEDDDDDEEGDDLEFRNSWVIIEMDGVKLCE